jgi:3-oxoacyl-ACP reductase-like protein
MNWSIAREYLTNTLEDVPLRRLRNVPPWFEGQPMKTAMRTHEGRVALVTGAAQGIGQAIAAAAAEPGAQVIATGVALDS